MRAVLILLGKQVQGCHKLGFCPSSRIFKMFLSYSDGHPQIFGFSGLALIIHGTPYARACNVHVHGHALPSVRAG